MPQLNSWRHTLTLTAATLKHVEVGTSTNLHETVP